MNDKLVARIPLQERSRQRVSLILQGAEALLDEHGLSAFSIPALSERLDFPRATIYKFFPTPYALLNTLAEQHLAALEQTLVQQVTLLAPDADWRTTARLMVSTAASYYCAHPVACILLLGGPVTDSSYRALEYTISRLGRLTHLMLQHAGLEMRENDPAEAALAIEFGTASLRLSFFLHQTITPAYVEAAGDVMIAFIEHRLNARHAL